MYQIKNKLKKSSNKFYKKYKIKTRPKERIFSGQHLIQRFDRIVVFIRNRVKM